MSVFRTFSPEVRLKRLLSASGGTRVSDALEQADRQLDQIRAACLAGVDAKIERMFELSQERSEIALEQCYVQSNEIFAEAGVFGLLELSAAALSLCSLLSGQDRAKKVPAAAIRVHIDAMRALRTPQVEGNDAMRQAVLSELEALARRFALTSAR
jgi:hypothetical protein